MGNEETLRTQAMKSQVRLGSIWEVKTWEMLDLLCPWALLGCKPSRLRRLIDEGSENLHRELHQSKPAESA